MVDLHVKWTFNKYTCICGHGFRFTILSDSVSFNENFSCFTIGQGECRRNTQLLSTLETVSNTVSDRTWVCFDTKTKNTLSKATNFLGLKSQDYRMIS